MIVVQPAMLLDAVHMRLSREVALHPSDFDVESFLSVRLRY